MSAPAARWAARPYSVAAADAIARDLGLSPTVAAVLARRGCETSADARRFLAADERHDPWLLGDMAAACDLILEHARRGGRILVHGDYDVDGVSSTAILVEALRAIGADPSWHLPARLEGYGLSEATVERIAAAGAGLLVTVDCGITSVAEVAAARSRGLDVVVTDHHRPGERLPDCPVVHPGLGSYPFDGLCAAGVAHKLSTALRSRAGLEPAGDRELELVALATVCDLVPLRGENRALVREGLAALARTRRPGLRALMGAASLDPGAVDERAVGFRLGPRLNAAGRLRRADAALELLLTDDEGRAAEVAEELSLLNAERRDVETRILFAAEAARTEQADAPLYVIAGEGWHPGVVGIVASRLTERYHRPCVLIALDSHGGRGSGRSIPAYDLHAGLAACSDHLRRFGGHRAAAGLEIEPGNIDAFRRDLARHAAGLLSPHDLVPVEEADAVVSGASLGLGLAEELRRLAPFGHGNPEPRLLVPGARCENVRGMGEEAQHARFTLQGSGTRAEAVAFRRTPAALRRDGAEACDAAVRLELNEWGGRVEARVVLEAICPVEAGACMPLGDERFWPALERELTAEVDAQASPPGPGRDEPTVVRGGPIAGRGEPAAPSRALRDRRGEGIAALAGELLSSGEPVLLVCADVDRRRATLERLVAGLARCAFDAGRAEAGAPADRALPVASWTALVEDPALAGRFRHLVALDPPSAPADLEAAVAAAPVEAPAFAHLAWGPVEVEFALGVVRAGLDLRGALVDAYRRLRDGGPAADEDLRALLGGDGSHPRQGAVCGRVLRVLTELGLARYESRSCRALAGPRTSLERSAAHRAYMRRLAECERYLAGEAARWGTPRNLPGAERAAAVSV
ncbi:hypothetical protein BH24ACT25_BH24ACT25_01460 [soil metagenome]